MMKFSDLAKQYFPDKKQHNSSVSLSRWILNCNPLLDDLRVMGHQMKSRYLTPRQIEGIYYHLGKS